MPGGGRAPPLEEFPELHKGVAIPSERTRRALCRLLGEELGDRAGGLGGPGADHVRQERLVGVIHVLPTPGFLRYHFSPLDAWVSLSEGQSRKPKASCRGIIFVLTYTQRMGNSLGGLRKDQGSELAMEGEKERVMGFEPTTSCLEGLLAKATRGVRKIS